MRSALPKMAFSSYPLLKVNVNQKMTQFILELNKLILKSMWNYYRPRLNNNNNNSRMIKENLP
jgi:hypothetical protein